MTFEVNHDRARFHDALHMLLPERGFHFVSSNLGRDEGGNLYHSITAMSDEKGVVTRKAIVPKGTPTWSEEMTKLVAREFRTEVSDIVDDWLEAVAARWETGCLASLEDIPPSPGDISVDDIIAEVRSRKS